MGKKNLEQLFKETFKEFHEVPDEKVWNSIEASLDKRKKKRVVPIWWQLGGVAALLAILFYVINPFEDTDNNVPIIVTETENNDAIFDKDSISESSETQKLTEASTNDDSDTVEGSTTNNQEDAQGSINRNQSIKPEGQIVSTNTSERKDNLERDDVRFNTVDNSNQNIASVDSMATIKSEMGNSQQDITDALNKNETQAIVSSEQKDKKETLLMDKVDNTPLQQEKSLGSFSENEAIAQNKEEEQESIVEKQSIFDVIKEQEEEAIAQNGTSGKWSVGPSVAPVYFNATGDGSPIHSNFASNSKSGNVNLSYGLTVAYNLNKRLKVRSGVHKVNYGYDTNEIVFSSSLDGSTNALIDNIDYSQTSRNLVVQSKNELPQSFANDASLELSASQTPELDGKMVQQLGYIEVPLELNYALIDKKFGVDLIGGVSSLFLVDNSVLLESEELVTEVGEANNANSVNFSTNVGVGLNYQFSSKVQLNLEPILKYQLNTFSETAGSFRPFSVGVYSGISFKF
nr:outer membrane beta-barrel protein [uncultured Allomuricauda sp.]